MADVRPPTDGEPRKSTTCERASEASMLAGRARVELAEMNCERARIWLPRHRADVGELYRRPDKEGERDG